MMPSTSSITRTSALTAQRLESSTSCLPQAEFGCRTGAAATAVLAGVSALASGVGA